MGRLKPPRFVKKAGGQVPAIVQKAMARHHPNVQILWAHEVRRWALVQSVRGKRVLICFLGTAAKFEPPTIANTVYALHRMHPSNYRSRRQQEQLIERLDANPGLEAARKRARDAVRVGSNDLFDVLNRKVRVARP